MKFKVFLFFLILFLPSSGQTYNKYLSKYNFIYGLQIDIINLSERNIKIERNLIFFNDTIQIHSILIDEMGEKSINKTLLYSDSSKNKLLNFLFNIPEKNYNNQPKYSGTSHILKVITVDSNFIFKGEGNFSLYNILNNSSRSLGLPTVFDR